MADDERASAVDPRAVRDAIAGVFLALFVVASTAAGFTMGVTVGLFTLAAASLIVALVLAIGD